MLSFGLTIPRSSIVLVMKLQTNAIDTMSLIRRRRITLSLEDMAEVAAAVRTNDLSPLHAKAAVCMAGHGARDTVEVSGPAAARFEFVVRLVQRRIAAGASVDTGRGHVLVILASEGRLGAFFSEDAELFYRHNTNGQSAWWTYMDRGRLPWSTEGSFEMLTFIQDGLPLVI